MSLSYPITPIPTTTSTSLLSLPSETILHIFRYLPLFGQRNSLLQTNRRLYTTLVRDQYKQAFLYLKPFITSSTGVPVLARCLNFGFDVNGSRFNDSRFTKFALAIKQPTEPGVSRFLGKAPDLYPAPAGLISILCLAVWRGNEAGARLLLEAGAQVETHMVWNALSTANYRIMEFYLQHGVDPNAKVTSHSTPLQMVEAFEDREVAERFRCLLVKYGAR
ncbi:hypothetical protein K440DRAFT_260247 [Wilcoxina mikolae CBS 423.85]|nr:hypothetical protein K440DRAFT_260247 [Wilcoxina mikolae CBS 423.85]